MCLHTVEAAALHCSESESFVAFQFCRYTNHLNISIEMRWKHVRANTKMRKNVSINVNVGRFCYLRWQHFRWFHWTNIFSNQLQKWPWVFFIFSLCSVCGNSSLLKQWKNPFDDGIEWWQSKYSCHFHSFLDTCATSTGVNDHLHASHTKSINNVLRNDSMTLFVYFPKP